MKGTEHTVSTPPQTLEPSKEEVDAYVEGLRVIIGDMVETISREDVELLLVYEKAIAVLREKTGSGPMVPEEKILQKVRSICAAVRRLIRVHGKVKNEEKIPLREAEITEFSAEIKKVTGRNFSRLMLIRVLLRMQGFSYREIAGIQDVSEYAIGQSIERFNRLTKGRFANDLRLRNSD